jgi:hypothetical protein
MHDSHSQERERKDSGGVEAKRTFWGEPRDALYVGGGRKSSSSEGTQAMSTRPSDKNRM